MKTVTKEELCGYWPYELKLEQDTSKWFEPIGTRIVVINQLSLSIDEKYGYNIGYKFGNTYGNFESTDFKPIMHPLSSLTKPVLEGGKIPIVELFNEVSGGYTELSYENGLKDFTDNILYSPIKVVPLWIANKLYQWHFWLGDQSFFDDGIIIDKSTQSK